MMRILSVCLFLLVPFTVNASLWRCDGWIIEPGLRIFEVSQKCGRPDGIERHTEWRTQTVQPQCHDWRGVFSTEVPYSPYPCVTRPVIVTIPVETEIWYFDDISVPKALYFENGQLIRVEPLWGLRHFP